MDASPDDPLIETARRLVRGIRVTEVDADDRARAAALVAEAVLPAGGGGDLGEAGGVEEGEPGGVLGGVAEGVEERDATAAGAGRGDVVQGERSETAGSALEEATTRNDG